MNSPRIAFNTANLVGRVTGYRFELANWGRQHEATAAATDEAAWRAICSEVAAAGYRAMEVWLTHVDPGVTDEAKARRFRAIMDEHGLEPAGLAGGLNERSAEVCGWMGLAAANGGIGNADPGELQRLSKRTGIQVNHENHPEKSVDEIRRKIGDGQYGIGVAVDTGWLGTQGVDAAAAVRDLGPLVRHVHVKDVAAPGGHHTVPLGSGCVDLRGVFRELKQMNYAGWLSWEDEPEDRNPMDIAAEMHAWITREWERA